MRVGYNAARYNCSFSTTSEAKLCGYWLFLLEHVFVRNVTFIGYPDCKRIWPLSTIPQCPLLTALAQGSIDVVADHYVNIDEQLFAFGTFVTPFESERFCFFTKKTSVRSSVDDLLLQGLAPNLLILYAVLCSSAVLMYVLQRCLSHNGIGMDITSSSHTRIFNFVLYEALLAIGMGVYAALLRTEYSPLHQSKSYGFSTQKELARLIASGHKKLLMHSFYEDWNKSALEYLYLATLQSEDSFAYIDPALIDLCDEILANPRHVFIGYVQQVFDNCPKYYEQIHEICPYDVDSEDHYSLLFIHKGSKYVEQFNSNAHVLYADVLKYTLQPRWNAKNLHLQEHLKNPFLSVNIGALRFTGALHVTGIVTAVVIFVGECVTIGGRLSPTQRRRHGFR